MSESKHTPGPWVVIPRPTNKVKYSVATDIAAPGQAVICDMHAHSVNCPDEVKAANAHLIAAAPELLAALESLERSLTVHDGEDMMGRVKGTWSTKDRDAARSAIAKARGGV